MCRQWELSMVIILPQGGQLQNYLQGDLADLENYRYLWVRVESKRSKKKKKKKKKLAEQHTCTGGKKLDGILVGCHAFIHHLYPRMLFLFLVAKTARTPPSWPEILFFRHRLGISRFAKCIQRDLWSSFWL